MRKWVVIGVVVFVAAAAFLLPIVQVRRDWAFKCDNTASEYGYTAWFGIVRTGAWIRTSALQRFIRQRYPSELTNRWVSYAGTGRNVFGRAVLYGHGRPTLIHLRIEILDEYTADLSDAEKKKLYDFLRTATGEEAKAKGKEIWEAVLRKSETE